MGCSALAYRLNRPQSEGLFLSELVSIFVIQNLARVCLFRDNQVRKRYGSISINLRIDFGAEHSGRCLSFRQWKYEPPEAS